MKKIKRELKSLNRENFSNIQERVTNRLLLDVQVHALKNPSPLIFQEEKELQQKLNFQRTIEESYFRQRSRINWLKEGDLNTTFFHRLMLVRNSYNSIRSFTLHTGEIVTDPMRMGDIAIAHFRQLLAPQSMSTNPCPPEWFQALTPFRCSGENSTTMILMPTDEEIRKTMFKLNENKSPGPDGLTSGFFKAAWKIVGTETITSIKNFFATAFLPYSMNSTILTLVPKRQGASAVTDFRPISCCNTIYKLISKLLVKCLKPLLPPLILPNQTAFVQGRLLVENTILASEIVHGYHRDKGPARITIKVDIAKAFDTIDWGFIFSMLQGLQIPDTYLYWLHACITTPSFMVGFNGTVQGYFRSTRGLRQGDPLSPYLFVMAMNCLSILLDKGAEDGRFRYHHHCKESKLTHLCFADDLLIFCDGDTQSIKNILNIIEQFTEVSGLAINISKTSFFTCGITRPVINQIVSETG